VRRLVECAVLRDLGEPPYPLDGLAAAVTAGEKARREEAWRELSTANIRFHQELAALAGSARTDELMRGVLAELRLVFHVMRDPRRFYEPYLPRNAQILRALEKGDARGAEALLASYLDDSLVQLSEAYARQMA
jgi:DNA-binding GntR family transcriptional regulator